MKAGNRFDKILEFLSIKNAELSRESGVDPSFISRFRRSTRIPGSASNQFKTICRAIGEIALREGKAKALIAEFALSETAPLDEAIAAYLLDKRGIAAGHSQKAAAGDINTAQRLDVIMEMLGITNVKLAKVLNVDASLISRYRNGGRTLPKKTSPAAYVLVDYFTRIVREKHLEKELEELMDKDFPDGYVGQKNFREWLLQGADERPIDAFLTKLGSISEVEISKLMTRPKAAGPKKVLPKGELYYGMEGLREAALRFLMAAACHKTPLEIRLYSDQPLTWMQDEDFMLEWGRLMHKILQKHKVKIIHNTERNLDEMLSGIDKWLEPYMSGSVQGYFCPGVTDKRFSNLLIVASGLAAISARHVYGTEANGLYRYTEGDTKFYEMQSEALLNRSRPLVMVYKEKEMRSNLLKMGGGGKKNEVLKRLCVGPAFDTMPRQVLLRMLSRKDISQEDAESIMSAYDLQRARFADREENRIMDFIALPSIEEVKRGRVHPNLAGVYSKPSITYELQEYQEHLKTLAELLENPRYEIVLLSKSPFDNIQMGVRENNSAIVIKTDNPSAAFRFDHELMTNALGKYIDRLGRNSAIRGKQRVLSFLNGEIEALMLAMAEQR